MSSLREKAEKYTEQFFPGDKGSRDWEVSVSSFEDGYRAAIEAAASVLGRLDGLVHTKNAAHEIRKLAE